MISFNLKIYFEYLKDADFEEKYLEKKGKKKNLN